MNKNILITGGAGFIGSRLVKALLSEESDCHIWILDNLHPQVHGINPAVPFYPVQVQFIRGDISNKESVRNAVLVSMPETIYHLAAETGTGQSYDEIVRYCEVNVTGTANLIEAIRDISSQVTKKVVLAASRAVYGEGAYLSSDGRIYNGLPRQPDALSAGDYSVPLPAGALLPAEPVASNSNLPPSPASIYASTKLMQEYLLKQAGEGAAWKAIILRFQNVYGPGQSLRNPYTGVLSIFSRQLLEGKSLSIYEDGLIARDFIFVDDVVSALIKARQAELPHGETIDIGSGEAITILSVARILMRSLGVKDTNYKITGDFRVGDIRHACADISAASKLLGWAPKVRAEDGLKQLAAWARSEYEQVDE